MITRDSSALASFWMGFLTLLIFFVPGLNGLLAGFVGGYRLGTGGEGARAAVLPALGCFLFLWMMLVWYQLPLVGWIPGVPRELWAFLSAAAILPGAALGGRVAHVQLDHRLAA